MSEKYFIVQQNDFGGDSMSLIGVCKSVDPELETFVTSDLPRYDVTHASESLLDLIRYWPANTVFVSVVDPGVGTERRACVAKLKNGGYIVTPDNGTLTLQLTEGMIEGIREIDQTVNRLPSSDETDIFHGRDVFAYTAARLAAGIIDFAGVGPEYSMDEIITYPIVYGRVDTNGAHGLITGCMAAFGNLETNIKISDFSHAGIPEGSMVHITICYKGEMRFDMDVLYHKSFGFAKEGEAIFYNSSTTFMGLGLNKASFMDRYQIGMGEDWTIHVRKK